MAVINVMRLKMEIPTLKTYFSNRKPKTYMDIKTELKTDTIKAVALSNNLSYNTVHKISKIKDQAELKKTLRKYR